MLPDRVSNPGPLTYESGALPIALRGPAKFEMISEASNTCSPPSLSLSLSLSLSQFTRLITAQVHTIIFKFKVEIFTPGRMSTINL